MSKYTRLKNQSQDLIIGWIYVEVSGWEEKTVVFSFGVKVRSKKLDRVLILGGTQEPNFR